MRAWIAKELPQLNEKHDYAVRMIRERASKLQRQLKQEKGFVILRAYYGSRKDIETHLDLNVVP